MKNIFDNSKMFFGRTKLKVLYVLIGFLSVCFSLSAQANIWNGVIPTASSSASYSGGNGTASNPYKIGTPQDLAQLMSNVNVLNNYSSGKYFQMTADIYLNNTADCQTWATNPPANSWQPIGQNVNGKYFLGVFDGNGYSIEGIYFDNIVTNYLGLFGYVSNNAIIKNINLQNGFLRGHNYVGSICGYAYGSVTIQNCINSITVNGDENVGGIIGFANGQSSNAIVNGCTNSGVVEAYKMVGGIIGQIASKLTLSNSVNAGVVKGASASIGGICGEIGNKTDIQQAINVGQVIYTGDGNCNTLGAICGNYSNNYTIENCFNDEQMAPVPSVKGTTHSGVTQVLTTDLTGTVSSLSSSNWQFENEMYPRVAATANRSIAKGASIPIFLKTSSASVYETTQSAESAFTMQTMSGFDWMSSNSSLIDVAGNRASIYATGSGQLSLIYNNTVVKSIDIFAASTTAGTQGNPLLITSYEDLAKLRDTINAGLSGSQTYKGQSIINGASGKWFLITNDIDMGGIRYPDGTWGGNNWVPIGIMMDGKSWSNTPYSNPNPYAFKGRVDGGNHRIYNLYCVNTSLTGDHNGYNIGLFGFTQDVIIKKLHIASGYVKGIKNAAGLLGWSGTLNNVNANSWIDSCSNNATVIGAYRVGGVVGTISAGKITNCTNSGTITGTATTMNPTYNESAMVGGVAGRLFGSAVNIDLNCYAQYCTNSGTVIGGLRAGGVLGDLNRAAIRDCANSGFVSGSDDVGGVVGICGWHGTNRTYEYSISNCFNAGVVMVHGGSNVGAISARLGSKPRVMENCYYDLQLCPLPYAIGGAIEYFPNAGQLTDSMTGTNPHLDGITSSGWSFSEGRYPIPNTLLGFEQSILYSLPAFFSVDAEHHDVETINNIHKDFTISTYPGYTWETQEGHISFSGVNATINSIGNDTIVLRQGNNVRLIPATIIQCNATGGQIGSNQSCCAGTYTARFTNITSATGTGTYQWQSSNDNITFYDIPGATAETYLFPDKIMENTYFRRVLKTPACGYYFSNTVTVDVYPTPNTEIHTTWDVWNGTATAWTQGDGTQVTPYLIETAEQLAYLAQRVNAGNRYSGKYFLLTTDINLDNRPWTPIGKDPDFDSNGQSFAGYFNGGQHAIYNLFVEGSNNLGLFGCIEGATITSLGIESGVVKNAETSLSFRVAGLVGRASNATINNCYNKADVMAYNYVGGIVGRASEGTVTISNCFNNAEIISTKDNETIAGGIVGGASSSTIIEQCYNHGI
ncbi:MAG: GLUG motif-containing protein, partial [Bacteroidales bacterium]|nr:GLUG motif-containing protein [Bacteroidales bacterium]